MRTVRKILMGTDHRNSQKQLPVDRGWAWSIVFACFGHVMLSVMAVRVTSILYVRLMAEYQASHGSIAILPALVCFGQFFSCFLSALLSERYGVRPIVVIGTLMWAVGFISSAFVNNITQLCLTYGVLIGVGMGFVYIPALTLLGRYFDEKRTLAFGIAGMGSGVGSVIGPLLTDYLLTSHGLAGCLIMLGGLQLHNLVFAALLRPLEFYKRPSRKKLLKRRESAADSSLVQLKEVKAVETTKPLSASTHNIESAADKSADELDDFFNCEPRQRAYTFQHGANADPEQLRIMFQQWRQLHRNVNIKDYIKERSNPSKYTKSQESGLHRLQTHNTVLPARYSSEKKLNKSMSHSITIAATPATSDDEEGGATPNLDCFGQEGALIQWSLFSNPVFALHALHSLFAIASVSIPIVFIAAYCEDSGISLQNAALLFSISGIAEFLVRPLIGWFANLNLVPKLHIKVTSLVAIAALTLSWTFVTSFAGILTLQILAMTFTSVFYLLEAVVLVDLLGMENLSSAFGMTLTIQSSGYLAGPIIAGYLRDSTGSWTWSYTISGLSAIASVACLLAIPIYRKYRPNEDKS